MKCFMRRVTITYLKIKSYRRKSESSDFSVLNWQFLILRLYIIKRQSHWIPGQARNDKRTQKTYFEIGSKKIIYMTTLIVIPACLESFLIDPNREERCW